MTDQGHSFIAMPFMHRNRDEMREVMTGLETYRLYCDYIYEVRRRGEGQLVSECIGGKYPCSAFPCCVWYYRRNAKTSDHSFAILISNIHLPVATMTTDV